MRSYVSLFIIIISAVLVSFGFTQTSAAADSNQQVDTSSFPYTAEITGDDVYVRSGPGTNFYRCGKVNKGDKVKVVDKQFSWSRIVPPAGSFSWISMDYVTINPGDSSVGTVTGDNVRVYAGSDFVKPLYSTSLQGKLSKGEKVKLLGEQMDRYYKIAPPPFAYLWVSTQFTKPLPKPVVVPPPAPTVPEMKTEPNAPAEVNVPAEVNAPVEVKPEPEAPKTPLERYEQLKEKVEAERAKPMDQQNYTELKKELLEIANDKEAGNAARYAQFVVGQIEGYELALAVVKEVKLQNEQLDKINAKIEKAKETKLAEIKNMGKYAVVGVFQTYMTFGPGNYRIVDKDGKMICYALPAGAASQMDLSGFVGQKVGLVGTIEPNLPTKKALVRFTQIVKL